MEFMFKVVNILKNKSRLTLLLKYPKRKHNDGCRDAGRVSIIGRRREFMVTGFTMMEILIVIGLIALFSGIIMINSGEQNNSLKLKTAVLVAVDDIRKAQNFSVSTRVEGTEIPNGGYGVRFDKLAGSYTVFSDINDPPNKVFDAGEQVDVKSLSSNIEIYEINLSSSGSVNMLDIVFVPPDPVTYINASNAFDLYADIVFRVKGRSCPQFCRTITVKTSGVIE